ncbi:MAG: hypothetical protein QX203_07980 [Methylococcaceae bacterium]
MARRDNFSQSVIRNLKDRVNTHCSNPSCRTSTSAPSSESSSAVNNTGIAAHICAASKGGPRYKVAMTPEERKSIDNAIWLCANCSIKIDRDKLFYTEEILKEWKYQAEETAKSEQGKKPPGKEDAIDTLAMALTGFPKRILVDAIANIHKASEKSLEALDPRFEIKIAHNENGTHIGVRAKENVPFKMNVKNNYAKEFHSGFNGLINHGEEVKIEARAISFEDLPLHEELLSQITDGVLHISPDKKIPAIQKLSIRDMVTNSVEIFDDIIGEIYCGCKSFTFKGTACNGLLNLKLKKTMDDLDDTVSIILSVSTKKWDQRDIRYLPYFDKILSLISRLANGCELTTVLEIEGQQILTGVGVINDDCDYITWLYGFLKYVEQCKIVSEFTNVKLVFSSDVSCTAEENRNLYNIVGLFKRTQIYTKDELLSNPKCELIVDSEAKNIEILSSTKEPSFIEIREVDKEQIILFKKKITLPLKIISIRSVLPKLIEDIAVYEEGDIAIIELVPCDDFSCEIYYEQNR